MMTLCGADHGRAETRGQSTPGHTYQGTAHIEAPVGTWGRPPRWYPHRVIGFIVLGVLAIFLVLGFVLNSRWVAKRGWVFNKHNPRPRGSGIPMSLDQIYQPSIEHMIKEQTSESIRADQDESGDKPNIGQGD
jgi:hypothetical protein